MISLDTVGGFNYHNSQKKYLHIVLDHATRYAWTFPSKSVTSETYTNCLKQIFSIQCPKQLLSDRNAAFTSSKFKKFLKHPNIRQLLTSANRPQCNGKNERVNQTLVAKLRCKVNSTTKTPWTKLLEQVTYEYNNSPHDVTGFPPAYLMFGTLPYDSPLPNQVKLNYPPIQQARQIAVNRTIKHHKINKQRYDKHYVDAKFKVGDLVLYQNFSYPNSSKLQSPYNGPFKVLEVFEVLGITQSVISRLRQRFQDDDNVSRRYSTGCSRVTKLNEDRNLAVTAIRNQHQTCLVSSIQATGRTISRQSVYRRLRQFGLYARRPVRCAPLMQTL
ncbi:retrotransposable element Tf2 protein type 3 [Trichonephila clavipes]|nr:retrotransposable element Tf2 protein type 3 [Trichonephila clavipes]